MNIFLILTLFFVIYSNTAAADNYNIYTDKQYGF